MSRNSSPALWSEVRHFGPMQVRHFGPMLIKMGVGAGFEIAMQAINNYRKGCDLLDIDNYDCWDVGVAAGVGAIAPGWFSTGKTGWRSGGALRTLSQQAQQARTANRAAKVNQRIQRHRDVIQDALITQGAWTGYKAAVKQANDKPDCSCKQ